MIDINDYSIAFLNALTSDLADDPDFDIYEFFKKASDFYEKNSAEKAEV